MSLESALAGHLPGLMMLVAWRVKCARMLKKREVVVDVTSGTLAALLIVGGLSANIIGEKLLCMRAALPYWVSLCLGWAAGSLPVGILVYVQRRRRPGPRVLGLPSRLGMEWYKRLPLDRRPWSVRYVRKEVLDALENLGVKGDEEDFERARRALLSEAAAMTVAGVLTVVAILL